VIGLNPLKSSCVLAGVLSVELVGQFMHKHHVALRTRVVRALGPRLDKILGIRNAIYKYVIIGPLSAG
jgi:hypothetical protein